MRVGVGRVSRRLVGRMRRCEVVWIAELEGVAC